LTSGAQFDPELLTRWLVSKFGLANMPALTIKPPEKPDARPAPEDPNG
jgi:hypothetical protein